MAIVQTLTTTAKLNLLQGALNFNAASFKIALYAEGASLDGSTAAYTTTGEVTGTGYTDGGNSGTVSSVSSSGSVAWVDFANVSWASSTITARGALIYVPGGIAVAVLDFGATKTSNNSTFQIQFPAGDAKNAIIRIE